MPKLLDKKSPIQGTSGSNREAESTDAPARGGLLRKVRFCERLGVKFPGPTRQKQTKSDARARSA